MKKQMLFLGTSLLLLGLNGFRQAKAEEKRQGLSPGIQLDHEDPDGYYTCSMHPQVHEHQPGKCPICGMPLIKRFAKKTEVAKPAVVSGPEVEISPDQLSLAGIGKYRVEKKDLVFSLPVMGRMISSREVVFQLFEADLQIVKTGAEFSGIAAIAPDEKSNGQIRSIDSLVDPSSRTVRVTGLLEKSPKTFVLEGSFEGEIHRTEKNQLAVPESAVLHTGKGSLVYIFTGENKLKSIPVVLGKKTHQEYQVLSGLRDGDVISTGPNFLIDSEAKIRGGGD